MKEEIAVESTSGIAKKSNKTPDIFNGPIAATTLKLSTPLIISQILVIAYTFTNMLFITMVDRQSTATVSGIGLVLPLYMCVDSLAAGLYMGVNSLIAKGIGENNKEIINKTAKTGLAISIGLSLIICIIGYAFGRPIIEFLAGSEITPEAIEYGIEYLKFLLPGMAALLISYVFAGMLQGEGLTKYIGLSVFISAIINIILDPVLIFVFKMGVKGAAIATSITFISSVAYYIFLFVTKKTTIPVKWNIFKASGKLVKEICRVGIPASIGLLSLNIAMIVLNNVVGSISQQAMNSWVLVSRVDQILLIPAGAIGGSTITMIGQNFARRNFSRVNKIFRVNILVSVGVCAFLSILYFILSPQIFGIFSDRQEVISGCVRQVRLLTFTTVFVAGSMVVSSSFQGIRKPLPDLTIVTLRTLFGYILVSMLLVYVADMKLNGIFIGIGVGNVLSFALAYFWGGSVLKKVSKDNPA